MIKILNKDAKISYSQSGEDLIVDFILNFLGIHTPTYLDIGAHHPSNISNTYRFYKKGATGICVEPDPTLFKQFVKTRPNDINLNVGVSNSGESFAKFYVMTSKTLNTFSHTEAQKCQETKNFGNQKIEKIINIPLVNINELIKKYAKSTPNFISIDVEGLDFEIVSSLDFSIYCPEVVCIETLMYNKKGLLEKNINLINFMLNKNYFIYADTYMNTIFINENTKNAMKAEKGLLNG